MFFGVRGTSWLHKPGPIPEGYCLPCLERNLRCHYRSKSRPITRATEIEPLIGKSNKGRNCSPPLNPTGSSTG